MSVSFRLPDEGESDYDHPHHSPPQYSSSSSSSNPLNNTINNNNNNNSDANNPIISSQLEEEYGYDHSCNYETAAAIELDENALHRKTRPRTQLWKINDQKVTFKHTIR